MAHDFVALLARARRALAPAAQKATPPAPPSLVDRARAARDRLRAITPAAKDAIMTSDLGPGVTPPQIVGAHDDKLRKRPHILPTVVGQIEPAQSALPDDMQPAAKPFATFPDFDACVAAQIAAGHDEESARRICGALQRDAEATKAEEDVGPPSGLPAKLVDFGGIPVLVDRPAGFVQTKLGPDGAVLWTRTYLVDYGGLAGTDGGDHELLDVFLGPDPTALMAWWCVQVDDAGAFDEYKLMLGFADEAAARACYVAHIPERCLASMAPMPTERLRALLGLPVLTLDPVTKASTLLDAIGEATGTRQRVELVASTKAATPDEQFIFGVVLMPERTDLQGEIYGAQVVRKTAHDYLAFFRNTDIQHKAFVNDAVDLVESYLAPTDFWVARDATTYPADPTTGQPYGAPEGVPLKKVLKNWWLVAHRVKDPELWAAIKRGDYTGYSINGLKKLAASVAAPPAAA